MKIRKCHMLIEVEPKWKRCTGEVFGKIKATVLHYPSDRVARQTWHLCKEHFNQAMSTCSDCGDPTYSGWKTIYRDPKKYAMVMNMQIIDEL